MEIEEFLGADQLNLTNREDLSDHE